MIDPASVLRLDGRSVLVTGGTRGIGRAIADASAWLTGEVLVVDGGAGVSARE